MITIHLTLDLFFQKWNAGGPLWFCIQPHVIISDLEASIRGLAEGNNFQYVMHGATSATDPSAFVPIPLPSNVDLTLELLSGGTAVKRIQNARINGRRVLDPTRLALDNRAPEADKASQS